MFRKKTSGVTLSIALATGLSSCYSVSAIDNKSNINNKILNGSHKDKSSSVKEQENAINRLMQTSKENLSPGEISYENKIRELEEVITQLKLATKVRKYRCCSSSGIFSRGSLSLSSMIFRAVR